MAESEDAVLAKLLHQVAEMFKMVEENKDKDFEKNVTPEVLARLEQLQGFFDQLNEENRKVFEAAGSSVAKLQQTVLSPSDTLENRWKNLFTFSKNLVKDLEAVYKRNVLSAQASQKDKPFDEAKQKKDEIKKRQKKFKEMGGGKDWVRM